MIPLSDIIKRDAQFSRNSGASVDIDRRLGTVAIEWYGGDGVFMHGPDADGFIAEVEVLAVDAPDVSREDIELHLARPYVECL